MSDVVYTNDQQVVEDAIESGAKVVVDFSAPDWCIPCQRFAPVFEAVADLEPDTKFYAVDVDNAPWAMADYGVQGVPTVVLFEDGERVRDLRERTAIKFHNELKD